MLDMYVYRYLHILLHTTTSVGSNIRIEFEYDNEWCPFSGCNTNVFFTASGLYAL